ncbi:MAG TPA: hypothetical protein VE007_00950 [Thermoanaerobaculia bacterium]|nr:hypothetical protein [Thermoanaerobaculia bacterium]
MYSVLVVGTPPSGGDGLEERLPSVEVLRARDADDAIEKLARNRRVDAVLLLEELPAARKTVSAIRDEFPAPPPVFLALPAGAPPPEGARPLEPGRPADLLCRVLDQIGR